MNKNLAYDYITLRLSEKAAVREELGFGAQHFSESDSEYDKRFLTYVENEGKIRLLEPIVIEYSKRK